MYQRRSLIVVKGLAPTTDFPTWGSGKETENLLVHSRTREKGAVNPEDIEPDLSVSFWESPAEAWVDGGLSWGQGH